MTAYLGRDTSCTDSLRTGRFVTGARLVGEACYRRLVTPRGSLRGGDDEAEYGIDLPGMIGGDPRIVAASLPGRIRSEITKDERVIPESVEVGVALVKDGPATSLNITISCETDAGPFTLVLLASAVTVELLGLSTP